MPSEACHHFKRSVQSDFKIRFFGKLRAIFYSLINERYGVFDGDIAIIGSDTLLNKLIAIKLASVGISSAVFTQTSHEIDPSGLNTMKEEGFSEALLPFFHTLTDSEPDYSISMDENLSRLITSINESNGKPVILLVNEARLSYHRETDYFIDFFVDFDSSIKGGGDYALSFWGLNQILAATEDREWDMYRARFRAAIMTSASEIIPETREKVTLTGGAKKPIYAYEQFRLADRFAEIKDAFSSVLAIETNP